MPNPQAKLEAKNIAPLIKKIASLPHIPSHILVKDSIQIIFERSLNQEEKTLIFETAHALKPWRKGPFTLDELLIDSEWQSFKKWNRIAPYLNLKDKEIADIGCNNGYYMFQMLPFLPKSITGFDPYALFKCQFDFINHFAQSTIDYELLGVEDLISYPQKFDVIFCMGVLYHRSDPIQTLKILAKALRPNGELILDTLILDCDAEVALCPPKSYAKMSNVYFIPSKSALQGWCDRAGFKSFETLEVSQTTMDEQRKTQWIDSMSLENFLHPNNPNKTIEGYQAPLRGYFKLKRN